VQFDALWSSSSQTSSDLKALQASTSKGCERCYNTGINAPYSNVEKVIVETCDDAIGQENDYLKREDMNLELEVTQLKKQAIRCNRLKITSPKITSQQPKKQVQHQKDERIEYAGSIFLNARRPHIKSGIGYKNGDKHNSRVNTRGQEFIKFTKANIQQEKKPSIKTTNNASYSYNNASHISHMSYHDFNASNVLMRNKFGKIIVLRVGPHQKRSMTCM
jgi:hypothetical protein